MAETLNAIESIPSAYPTENFDLSEGAAALDASVIWARIEAYTAHRFTSRAVAWTVEGEGDWTPPLIPAVITATEKWEGGAWVSVSIPDGPYGLCLPSDGPYRITADVGGGDVPAPVAEAFRRLAEYLVEKSEFAGSSSFERSEGDISLSVDRAPTWIARAIINSGAADLLRPYRRA